MIAATFTWQRVLMSVLTLKADRSGTLAVVLALACSAALFWFLCGGKPLSADLRAVWNAATMLAEGRPDLVYRSEDVFTMTPPEGWLARAIAEGAETPVYPYLYPPLWAALLAPLTRWASFAQVSGVFAALNPILLALTLELARRAAGRPLAPVPWIALGTACLGATWIGTVALMENQPQILVAFLCVLALERHRAGAPVAAGAALALAAATKLYPAAFALFLLAAGDRRAALAFAGFGGALALASVALAGWPLHESFLDGVATLSRSVLVSNAGYSLDGLLAALGLAGERTWIVGATTPGYFDTPFGWAVAAKPAAWALASRLGLVAVVVASALAIARSRDGTDTRIALLWAAGMAALALLSPLAWAYYFIAPMAFLPAVLAAWPPLFGFGILGIVVVPLTLPVGVAISQAVPGFPIAQAVGTVAMAVLVLLLLATSARRA